MHTGKLSNKTALITGGTSGIGLATAKRFLNEGANVIVTGKEDHHFQSARDVLGDKALVLAIDSGDIHAVHELTEQIRTISEKLDILFLNAGIFKPANLESITEADFDAMYNLHVKGPLFTIKGLLPIIPENGSIICTTSNSSRVRVDNSHIYASSKAALGRLVQSLASELSSRKIRVNAISPGPISTNITEGTMNPSQIDDLMNFTLARVPMKRFANPEEIATVATFLASSDSSFITGAEIAADGGWAPGVGV